MWVGGWGGGVDAVCIVQWISSLIVTLEGCAKKKCKKKQGMEKTRDGWNGTTNPLHLIILSELAQSSLLRSWICTGQIMVVETMKAP